MTRADAAMTQTTLMDIAGAASAPLERRDARARGQDVRVEPFFLPAAVGTRYCVYHCPVAGPLRGTVVCLPAFNEEMNRCRSMITLQATALAEIGIATLVIDPSGTGDSSGEFLDARWDDWLDDVDLACRWLQMRGQRCVALWGVRLGCLLAAEALTRGAAPHAHLIAWQPVVEGKLHLTQFLRVRIAAAMERSGGPRETTASLRSELAAGKPIEVAGYALHPALTAAIDQRRLTALRLPSETRVLWAEHASATDPQLPPASQRAIEQLRTDGCVVTLSPFTGIAFWQVHDRALAPALIQQTRNWAAATLLPEQAM